MARSRPKSTSPRPAEPPRVVAEADDIAWDDTADVVVVGFGGAGACTALEAREAGLDVVALDRFHGGGATAISGGVFYAGGGTHIQNEAKVEDSVEAMYRYLSLEVKDAVRPETLRALCESSVANLKWLESHGVPFEASLCPYKTSYPLDLYYLYYSGNEGFSPYKEQAKPAPRGHRAKGKGLPGESFYEPLRASAHARGVRVEYQSRVERLVTDDHGRVHGLVYRKIEGLWARLHRLLAFLAIKIVHYSPGLAQRCREGCFGIEVKHSVERTLRARRGVVLTAGGFIYNREMVMEHAPAYRRGMPLGTVADNGSGILLGQSVGGAIARMGRVSAWRFINPPEAFTRGMIVNKKGERYINEMMYGAAIGEAMVDRNDGVAILVIDETLKKLAREQCKPGKAQWFQRAPALLNLWFNARRFETLEELAKRLKMPVETLRETVAAYNRAAKKEAPDAFGKDADRMHALEAGPFYAIDCGIASKRFPCPTLTLGGLVVDEENGQVKRADGSRIEGLFAAGRNAVGVCSQQYVSGLSIADCVFSGRRAGRALAQPATKAEPAVQRAAVHA